MTSAESISCLVFFDGFCLFYPNLPGDHTSQTFDIPGQPGVFPKNTLHQPLLYGWTERVAPTLRPILHVEWVDQTGVRRQLSKRGDFDGPPQFNQAERRESFVFLGGKFSEPLRRRLWELVDRWQAQGFLTNPVAVLYFSPMEQFLIVEASGELLIAGNLALGGAVSQRCTFLINLLCASVSVWFSIWTTETQRHS